MLWILSLAIVRAVGVTATPELQYLRESYVERYGNQLRRILKVAGGCLEMRVGPRRGVPTKSEKVIE